MHRSIKTVAILIPAQVHTLQTPWNSRK